MYSQFFHEFKKKEKNLKAMGLRVPDHRPGEIFFVETERIGLTPRPKIEEDDLHPAFIYSVNNTVRRCHASPGSSKFKVGAKRREKGFLLVPEVIKDHKTLKWEFYFNLKIKRPLLFNDLDNNKYVGRIPEKFYPYSDYRNY